MVAGGLPADFASPARAIAEAHMTDTVGILRDKRTDDGAGNIAIEPGALVAEVPGRLKEVSGREAVIAGQVAQAVTGVICVPVGADVRSTDRLLHHGKHYEVALIVAESEATQAQQKVLVSGSQ